MAGCQVCVSPNKLSAIVSNVGRWSTTEREIKLPSLVSSASLTPRIVFNFDNAGRLDVISLPKLSLALANASCNFSLWESLIVLPPHCISKNQALCRRQFPFVED